MVRTGLRSYLREIAMRALALVRFLGRDSEAATKITVRVARFPSELAGL